jgi:hypothetical protein
MNAVLPEVKAEFFQDGKPLAGGKVYFYEPGTTTPKTTYSDAAGTVPNTNPVVLDSQGRATIFISGFYKVKVTTALGTELYTTDNVSASPFQALTVSEWLTSGVTPTYISAVSFSVPGDYTGTFEVGRRIKAAVSAGTVYGTIITATYGTGVTTVTVINDSGALDSGLASVDTGILSLTNKAIPVEPVVTKTDDYILVKADHGKTIIFNKATAVIATLPSPSAVWSGWKVALKNIGAGTLTITGTVDGASNPTLTTSGEMTLYSNGTSFYRAAPAYVSADGALRPISATPAANTVPVRDGNKDLGDRNNVPLWGLASESSGKNTSSSLTFAFPDVTAGDRIMVCAFANITWSTGTYANSYANISQTAGSATILMHHDRTNQTSYAINWHNGTEATGQGFFIIEVTGSGTLTMTQILYITGVSTIVYDNQMAIYFLKKQ